MPQPAPSRVAPTAKIPDDAPLAAPTRQPGPVSGPHVSYAPPAMPPPSSLQHAPTAMAGQSPYAGSHGQYGPVAQTAPTLQRPVQRLSEAIPSGRGSHGGIDASSPSMSFAEPSRPLGLIAIVMLVDLVLAGTGSFMLAKGLSKREASPPTGERAQGSAAPIATPVTVDAPAGSPDAEAGVGSAEPAGSDAEVASVDAGTASPTGEDPGTSPKPAAGTNDGSAGTGDTPTKPSTKPGTKPSTKPTKPATKPTKPTTKPSGPVTSPSGGSTGEPVSTQAEISALAQRSHTAFENCRRDAGPVHGDIEVAFSVMGNGSISDVSVRQNSTNNTELARCLLMRIKKWKVTPHGGAPLPFVRPFNYP